MTSTTATVAGPRAGRREWIGMAVLALPTLLLALDMSVLYLALPHLSADLGADSTQQLWIMDIYGFMIAGFLITMGTLGDRIGRRKLLLIGSAAFGAASVAAAYSSSPTMLIATRALLGVAGATLMPSTLALISNMFRDAKQRGLAIAVWMSCFMGGTAVGPIVGGVLLETFWWGAAFLLGVPVMALLLVTAPLLLPEYCDPQAGRLDLTSVALSLATILPVIYGLKDVAKHGLGTLPVLAVVVGVAFGAAFVRRQRRLLHPLMDLRLFSNRSFSAALGIMLLATVTMGGTFLFASQYLQLVEGLSPLHAGLWLVPPTVVMIASSMLTPAVARRVRPGFALAGALVLGAAGFALVSQVPSVNGVLALVIAMGVAQIGMGPLGALCTELVVSSAPPEKAGSASAMSETSGEFGIAMGVATLGSIGTAIYRGQIAGTMPAGLPAEAAAAAGDTLAGAVAAAGQLPAGVAGELLATAREAFTSGMNTVAAAAAVVTLLFAVLAVVTLRHDRPDGQAQGEQKVEEVRAETVEAAA